MIVSSGTPLACAFIVPVSALVAPGPEVTSTTPSAAAHARVPVRHVGGAGLVAADDVVERRRRGRAARQQRLITAPPGTPKNVVAPSSAR